MKYELKLPLACVVVLGESGLENRLVWANMLPFKRKKTQMVKNRFWQKRQRILQHTLRLKNEMQ